MYPRNDPLIQTPYRIARWLARPPATVATGSQVAGVLAMIANGYTIANDLDGLRKAYAAITTLRAQEPHLDVVPAIRVMIAANLSLTAGAAGLAAEAAKMYKAVAHISDERPADERVRALRGQLASDLVIDLVATGNVDGLRELLDEYNQLMAQHRSEAFIRDVWSKIAYHYLHIVGGRRDFTRAQPVARLLHRIAATYPNEVNVRQRAARSAWNLMLDYVPVPKAPYPGADLSQASGEYARLRTLIRCHTADPEIRAQFLKGAGLMVRVYRERRDQLSAQSIEAEVRFRLGALLS